MVLCIVHYCEYRKNKSEKINLINENIVLTKFKHYVRIRII